MGADKPDYGTFWNVFRDSILTAIAGSGWPEADEELLGELAEAEMAFGRALADLQSGAFGGVAQILAAWGGDVGPAVLERWQLLSGEEGGLADAMKVAFEASGVSTSTAGAAHAVKVRLYIALTATLLLLYPIVSAASPGGPPAMAAAAAGTVAAARIKVAQIFAQYLARFPSSKVAAAAATRLAPNGVAAAGVGPGAARVAGELAKALGTGYGVPVVRGSATFAGFGGGIELAAQQYEILEGTRGSYDLGQIGNAAATGAVAGAVFPVVRGGLGALTSPLARRLPAAGLAANTARFSGAVLRDAAAMGVALPTANRVIHGQPFSAAGFLAGAAMGGGMRVLVSGAAATGRAIGGARDLPAARDRALSRELVDGINATRPPGTAPAVPLRIPRDGLPPRSGPGTFGGGIDIAAPRPRGDGADGAAGAGGAPRGDGGPGGAGPRGGGGTGGPAGGAGGSGGTGGSGPRGGGVDGPGGGGVAAPPRTGSTTTVTDLGPTGPGGRTGTGGTGSIAELLRPAPEPVRTDADLVRLDPAQAESRFADAEARLAELNTPPGDGPRRLDLDSLRKPTADELRGADWAYHEGLVRPETSGTAPSAAPAAAPPARPPEVAAPPAPAEAPPPRQSPSAPVTTPPARGAAPPVLPGDALPARPVPVTPPGGGGSTVLPETPAPPAAGIGAPPLLPVDSGPATPPSVGTPAGPVGSDPPAMPPEVGTPPAADVAPPAVVPPALGVAPPPAMVPPALGVVPPATSPPAGVGSPAPAPPAPIPPQAPQPIPPQAPEPIPPQAPDPIPPQAPRPIPPTPPDLIPPQPATPDQIPPELPVPAAPLPSVPPPAPGPGAPQPGPGPGLPDGAPGPGAPDGTPAPGPPPPDAAPGPGAGPGPGAPAAPGPGGPGPDAPAGPGPAAVPPAVVPGGPGPGGPPAILPRDTAGLPPKSAEPITLVHQGPPVPHTAEPPLRRDPLPPAPRLVATPGAAPVGQPAPTEPPPVPGPPALPGVPAPPRPDDPAARAAPVGAPGARKAPDRTAHRRRMPPRGSGSPNGLIFLALPEALSPVARQRAAAKARQATIRAARRALAEMARNRRTVGRKTGRTAPPRVSRQWTVRRFITSTESLGYGKVDQPNAQGVRAAVEQVAPRLDRYVSRGYRSITFRPTPGALNPDQVGVLTITPRFGRGRALPVLVREQDGDIMARTVLDGDTGEPLRIEVESRVPVGEEERYVLRELVHEVSELHARRWAENLVGRRLAEYVDVLDRHSVVPRRPRGARWRPRLSPNDHGRLGEAVALVRQPLPAAPAGTPEEEKPETVRAERLAQWVDATGLRVGYPGAEDKWALVENALPADVRTVVGQARQGAATTLADQHLIILHRELLGRHTPEPDAVGPATDWFQAFRRLNTGLAPQLRNLSDDDLRAWIDATGLGVGYPGAADKWALAGPWLPPDLREVVGRLRTAPPESPADRAVIELHTALTTTGIVDQTGTRRFTGEFVDLRRGDGLDWYPAYRISITPVDDPAAAGEERLVVLKRWDSIMDSVFRQARRTRPAWHLWTDQVPGLPSGFAVRLEEVDDPPDTTRGDDLLVAFRGWRRSPLGTRWEPEYEVRFIEPRSEHPERLDRRMWLLRPIPELVEGHVPPGFEVRLEAYPNSFDLFYRPDPGVTDGDLARAAADVVRQMREMRAHLVAAGPSRNQVFREGMKSTLTRLGAVPAAPFLPWLPAEAVGPAQRGAMAMAAGTGGRYQYEPWMNLAATEADVLRADFDDRIVEHVLRAIAELGERLTDAATTVKDATGVEAKPPDLLPKAAEAPSGDPGPEVGPPTRELAFLQDVLIGHPLFGSPPVTAVRGRHEHGDEPFDALVEVRDWFGLAAGEGRSKRVRLHIRFGSGDPAVPVERLAGSDAEDIRLRVDLDTLKRRANPGYRKYRARRDRLRARAAAAGARSLVDGLRPAESFAQWRGGFIRREIEIGAQRLGGKRRHRVRLPTSERSLAFDDGARETFVAEIDKALVGERVLDSKPIVNATDDDGAVVHDHDHGHETFHALYEVKGRAGVNLWRLYLHVVLVPDFTSDPKVFSEAAPLAEPSHMQVRLDPNKLGRPGYPRPDPLPEGASDADRQAYRTAMALFRESFREFAEQQRQEGNEPPREPAAGADPVARAAYQEQRERYDEKLREEYDRQVQGYFDNIRKAIERAVQPLWVEAQRTNPLVVQAEGSGQGAGARGGGIGARGTANQAQQDGTASTSTGTTGSPGQGSTGHQGASGAGSAGQGGQPPTPPDGMTTVRHSLPGAVVVSATDAADRVRRVAEQKYDQAIRVAKVAAKLAAKKYLLEQVLAPRGRLLQYRDDKKITEFLLELARAVSADADRIRVQHGSDPSADPRRAERPEVAQEVLDLLTAAGGKNRDPVYVAATADWRKATELTPLAKKTLAEKLEFFAAGLAPVDGSRERRLMDQLPATERDDLAAKIDRMRGLLAFEALPEAEREAALGGREQREEFEEKTTADRIAALADVSSLPPVPPLEPAELPDLLADLRTFTEVTAFEELATGEQLLALDAIVLSQQVSRFLDAAFVDRSEELSRWLVSFESAALPEKAKVLEALQYFRAYMEQEKIKDKKRLPYLDPEHLATLESFAHLTPVEHERLRTELGRFQDLLGPADQRRVLERLDAWEEEHEHNFVEVPTQTFRMSRRRIHVGALVDASESTRTGRTVRVAPDTFLIAVSSRAAPDEVRRIVAEELALIRDVVELGREQIVPQAVDAGGKYVLPMGHVAVRYWRETGIPAYAFAVGVMAGIVPAQAGIRRRFQQWRADRRAAADLEAETPGESSRADLERALADSTLAVDALGDLLGQRLDAIDADPAATATQRDFVQTARSSLSYPDAEMTAWLDAAVPELRLKGHEIARLSRGVYAIWPLTPRGERRGGVDPVVVTVGHDRLDGAAGPQAIRQGAGGVGDLRLVVPNRMPAAGQTPEELRAELATQMARLLAEELVAFSDRPPGRPKLKNYLARTFAGDGMGAGTLGVFAVTGNSPLLQYSAEGSGYRVVLGGPIERWVDGLTSAQAHQVWQILARFENPALHDQDQMVDRVVHLAEYHAELKTLLEQADGLSGPGGQPPVYAHERPGLVQRGRDGAVDGAYLGERFAALPVTVFGGRAAGVHVSGDRVVVDGELHFRLAAVPPEELVDEQGEPVVSRIRTGGGTAENPFLVEVSELASDAAIERAVPHEIGHKLAGPVARGADPERVPHEIEARVIAHQIARATDRSEVDALIAAARALRAEMGDLAGLPPDVRTFLGALGPPSTTGPPGPAPPGGRRADALRHRAGRAAARARRLRGLGERAHLLADALPGTDPRLPRLRSAAVRLTARADAHDARAETLRRRADALRGGPDPAAHRTAARAAATVIEARTRAAYQTLVSGGRALPDRAAAVRDAIDTVERAVRDGGRGAYASLVLGTADGGYPLVALAHEATGVHYLDPVPDLATVRHVEALVVDGGGAPVPIPGAPRGLHNRHPVPAAYDDALPAPDRAAAELVRAMAELVARLAVEAPAHRRADDLLTQERSLLDEARAGRDEQRRQRLDAAEREYVRDSARLAARLDQRTADFHRLAADLEASAEDLLRAGKHRRAAHGADALVAAAEHIAAWAEDGRAAAEAAQRDAAGRVHAAAIGHPALLAERRHQSTELAVLGQWLQAQAATLADDAGRLVAEHLAATAAPDAEALVAEYTALRDAAELAWRQRREDIVAAQARERAGTASAAAAALRERAAQRGADAREADLRAVALFTRLADARLAAARAAAAGAVADRYQEAVDGWARIDGGQSLADDSRRRAAAELRHIAESDHALFDTAVDEAAAVAERYRRRLEMAEHLLHARHLREIGADGDAAERRADPLILPLAALAGYVRDLGIAVAAAASKADAARLAYDAARHDLDAYAREVADAVEATARAVAAADEAYRRLTQALPPPVYAHENAAGRFVQRGRDEPIDDAYIGARLRLIPVTVFGGEAVDLDVSAVDRHSVVARPDGTKLHFAHRATAPDLLPDGVVATIRAGSGTVRDPFLLEVSALAPDAAVDRAAPHEIAHKLAPDVSRGASRRVSPPAASRGASRGGDPERYPHAVELRVIQHKIDEAVAEADGSEVDALIVDGRALRAEMGLVPADGTPAEPGWLANDLRSILRGLDTVPERAAREAALARRDAERLDEAPTGDGRTVADERRAADRIRRAAVRWADRAAALRGAAREATGAAEADRLTAEAEAAERRRDAWLAEHEEILERVDVAVAGLTGPTDGDPDEWPASLPAQRALERAWPLGTRPATVDGSLTRLVSPFPDPVDGHAAFARGWLGGAPTVASPAREGGPAVDEAGTIELISGARYQTLVAGPRPMDGADRAAAVRSALDTVARLVRDGGRHAYASLVLERADGTFTLVTAVHEETGVRYLVPPHDPAASLADLLGSAFADRVHHVEALVVDGHGAPVPIPGAPRGLHSRHVVPEAYDAALPEPDRAAARLQRAVEQFARDTTALRRARERADEARQHQADLLIRERELREEQATHRLAEVDFAATAARIRLTGHFASLVALDHDARTVDGPPAGSPEENIEAQLSAYGPERAAAQFADAAPELAAEFEADSRASGEEHRTADQGVARNHQRRIAGAERWREREQEVAARSAARRARLAALAAEAAAMIADPLRRAGAASDHRRLAAGVELGRRYQEVVAAWDAAAARQRELDGTRAAIEPALANVAAADAALDRWVDAQRTPLVMAYAFDARAAWHHAKARYLAEIGADPTGAERAFDDAIAAGRSFADVVGRLNRIVAEAAALTVAERLRVRAAEDAEDQRWRELTDILAGTAAAVESADREFRRWLLSEPPLASGLATVLAGSRGILIDFDGPVTDLFTVRAAADGLARIRALLDAAGAPLPADIAAQDNMVAAVRWAFGLGRPELSRALEDALTGMDLAAAGTAEPTPFAVDVLRAAHAAGRPVAIVSNTSAAGIAAYLDRHGLADLVTVVIGRVPGEPDRWKPAPDPIRRAASALGLDPGSVVLIGDEPADIAAARAAGARIIGYANKPSKVPEFATSGLDAVVTSMREIAEALRALRGQSQEG
ncbi:HAD family hydrolase [Actinomycetes bacterium KLBMP 9797]